MFDSSPHPVKNYSVVLIRARRGPFLLQKRTRRDHLEYVGRISLFGGRREGDETPVDCAIREVAEEIGLMLSPNDLHLIASLESMNESGDATCGSIFLHEIALERDLRRLKIADGKAVFVAERDICRYWPKLTSIAAFALSAYGEFRRAARNEAIRTSSLGRAFSFLRR